MAGMQDAIKRIMMQRAIQGGGGQMPMGGSRPMAPGAQGMPVGRMGGGANPAMAAMAAKGGKAAPKAKAKGKPAPKGKGKPVAKKKAK